MTDFIQVVRGDSEVSDLEALGVFEVLVPMLGRCPDDAPAQEAARRTIERMRPGSRLAAVLDWWFVVTTGAAPPLGLAFHLPESIPQPARGAMESLAGLTHQGLQAAPAQWVQARRELDDLHAGLDSFLVLDNYGKSKMPREREVWSFLQDELEPVLNALSGSSRAERYELDDKSYAREMKRRGIEENSRRWNEMLKRGRQCVDQVNEVVRVQHVVEPWVRREPPAPLTTVDPELGAELGSLAGLVLGPVVDPNSLNGSSGLGPSNEALTASLDAIASPLSGADLAWLALIARGWVTSTGAEVTALAGAIERRATLEGRIERLRHDGVDVLEAEVALLDHDLPQAETLIDQIDNQRRLDRRASALSMTVARLRESVAGADGPSEWTSQLGEAERLLDGGDQSGAEELVHAVDQAMRASNRIEQMSELRELRDELEGLRAPQMLMVELDEHLEELAAKPEKAVEGSLLSRSRERLDSLVTQRRREANEQVKAGHELLDTERDLIHPDALPDLELKLDDADHRLERGEVMEALALATEVIDGIETQRVRRWQASEGEAPLVEHVIDYCTQQLHFDPDDVRRLYVAAKTKPFVILAGLTGSGKSTITRLFAGALGADARNGRFRRVAVRPDWIDQSEVLGSVNPLRNRFEPGWLAEVARQCERNLDQIHVVLLDEMNLAPVEQYLAEYLSALEESRSGSETTMLPLYSEGADPDNATEWPASLPFPRNLILLGTVNVDETTRVLSDRVLDRANVLQLSVAISDAHHRPRARSVRPWYVPFSEWEAICARVPDDGHHEFLVEVGEILKEIEVGVGQRAHIELERFVANGRGVLDPTVSLDLGLLQRIIPKIRGFKRDLHDGLVDLFDLLQSVGCERSARVVGRWLDPAVPDDDYLDGTDARIGLRR